MAASKPIGTETTDIASLWGEALKNYYETTGQDLRTLPRFTSVSDIMNDTQLKNDHFDNFRHDKGKVDKLRSAITRNSDLVMKGAQYIAQAATPACKDVSADYDKITSFFDEMNNFLERVSIIESRMPSVPAYKLFLTRVFSSMMNLLAIATKAVKKGRFKKWFKTLLEGGGDDDLAGAYGTMETALKRLESATNFATLGNTEDIKKDTKDIIVTTERVDMKTQKIDMTTQNIQVSVQEGFLQVTELQSQLAENFAKMMEHQKKESAKRAAPTQQHKPRDPGTRKHAAFSFVRRFFLKPAVLAEQARDIESSFVHGTAEWIFQEEAYETWASHEKSILFLLGGPGVGKSNLAFSAVQKLSQIADYDTRTSVAYFYFKDEQEELCYMSKATTCIIRQLAEQDPIYCEQVAAELNKTEDDLDTVNWQALWEDYILSKFPSDTEGHAYLIIDGLDEAASSAEKKSFLELLQKLKAGESNVHVLVTLRPITEYSPQSEKLSYTELNITKEQISVDFPTLIDARMDRLKGLSKICKFRKQVKRKIRTELQQNADGMLFIEHMLRRYNSIGREGAVLKDMVNFCPTDLSSLYALMLSECQGRRSPDQYQSLKKLFSWLAFSRRPLSLNEASALVALTGQDSSFSIEEELEGKSARILEISTPLGAGDVSDASDNEDDEKDENLARDDGSFPLRFQERSLREYFQAMSVDDEGLRTSPSTAHLTIFENAVSIICGISTNSTQLSAYSAKFWCSHFLNIDPSAVSERDTARVIENLALILSNHNDASKLIEKFGSHYTSIFGNAPADSPFPNNFFSRVQEWLDRAHSENGGLSEVASAWVQNTKASPKKMMVPLAEAHVKNWISGPYADVMRKSFGFALDALSMTDLISPTTSKQRTNPSAELLISVANIFDIVRDARSYRCIGLVITNYGHYEASLDYFQKSLELSSVDDVRSFYNRVSIAKAHMDLADSNDEDDDDQPHVTAAYENIKEALKIEYHPENDKTRQDIANQKRVALLSRAKCERRLRKFDDARVSYEEAKDILPTVTMPGAVLNRWTILLTDEQLLDTLAQWTLWDRMSWLTFIDDGDEEDGDDEIEFKDPNDRFQEAAKKLGKLDFMVETYQQIIAYKIRFKQAGYPRLQLAHAFRDVIGDAKKAKELLYDIMDSDSCIDPYTGDEDFDTVLDTRFEISDILYEEFRASSDPIAKIAFLEEYKRIPERRLARSINMFGIYDSQTAIIAARMTKLVGTATEYQEILERTFQSCMDGLTDTEGWNDTSSLRLLAKALVCVGMNKEAQMALSAQFSIIDPDVSHSDYSSDESDSEGSSENEDGSSDDDEGSEEGGDGASAAKTQSSGKKTAEEDDTEDIAPDSHIFCNGECKKPEHATWKDGPMYSCLVCTDCDLCESCYQIQTARNLGEPHEFWRSYCGKNHRYIKAPIEGWKGIKDGVMTIGEEKTKFTEWLNDLENKWKEAWKRFWLNEGLQNDIV